jgi:hypothetical protein
MEGPAEGLDEAAACAPCAVPIPTYAERTPLTDLVLLIEGCKELFYYKAVLAMQSPVFKAMLTNGMAETNAHTVELPDELVVEMRIFLHFLEYVPLIALHSTTQR